MVLCRRWRRSDPARAGAATLGDEENGGAGGRSEARRVEWGDVAGGRSGATAGGRATCRKPVGRWRGEWGNSSSGAATGGKAAIRRRPWREHRRGRRAVQRMAEMGARVAMVRCASSYSSKLSSSSGGLLPRAGASRQSRAAPSLSGGRGAEGRAAVGGSRSWAASCRWRRAPHVGCVGECGVRVFVASTAEVEVER